ncbi:sec14 cytosolic factor isoform X2 [Elaeis guineensis]|nr:sec14 cytosolic factor isoform X2 [Elaeis guineensis]XP_029116776.1 sec14 cytosolic factor isoform X2 [Elaeis guineensis]
MDKAQEVALTRMKASVQKLGGSAERSGDPTLMRFLIARSMDPQKAAKMFVQWQKWRAAFVPNGFIPESQIPDELEARKTYLQGLSKDGYPVLIFKGSRHFACKDHLQCKRFVVYMLDKAIASSFKGCEIGNEKLIVIIDLQHLTYKNFDARGLVNAIQILQAYYPERVAKLFFLHMPRFFSSVLKMITRYLEKGIREKIVIVKNEEKREFVEEIGEEALPKDEGGRAQLVAIQDVIVPPWNG